MNGFAFEDVPTTEVATSASLFYLFAATRRSAGVALCAWRWIGWARPECRQPRGARPAAPLALVPMALARRERRIAGPEADAA